MIRKWLKQVNPPPTWKSLAEAVEVVDPGIAERIENIVNITLTSESFHLSLSLSLSLSSVIEM